MIEGNQARKNGSKWQIRDRLQISDGSSVAFILQMKIKRHCLLLRYLYMYEKRSGPTNAQTAHSADILW